MNLFYGMRRFNVVYNYDPTIRENDRFPPHPDKPWLINLDSHAVIFGKTGTGKSNYIKNVLSHLDGNVVLLDPHGDVADFFLSVTRKKAVFLSGRNYEGSDGNYAGVNLLSTSGVPEEAHLIGDWVKQAFSKDESLSKGTWGPRLDLVFSSVLVEMIKRKKGFTLRDFTNLLPNGKKLLSYFPMQENSPVGTFLRLQNLNSKQWSEFVTSSMNKLLPLVESPLVRRVISATDERSVDLDSAILSQDGAIVPELNMGRIGENSVRVISTLLLARIWNVLLRRGPTKLKTYVVIDEAHLITEPILETFLGQGRKYGITLILGYQFPNQLSENFMETLFSNVQGYACFTMSRSGAELIARNTPRVRSVNSLINTLENQEKYKVTVSCETYEAREGVPGRISRYGPVTYIPELIGDAPPQEEINRLKALMLKNTGFPDPELGIEEVSDWTGHNRMIFLFSDFLDSRNIPNIVEPDLGGLVPDILIRHKDKEIICEVEDSDLLVTHRVAKKMVDYAGSQLMFLCRREDFPNLVSLLTNIVEAADKNEDYIYEGEKIHAAQAIKAIPNVSIVTLQDQMFYFYNGIGMVKLLAPHLERSSSMDYRAKRLPLGNLRSSVLNDYVEMISKGGSVELDTLEAKYGRDRLRSLLQSIVERGYGEPKNITALLELDKIARELQDEQADQDD